MRIKVKSLESQKEKYKLIPKLIKLIIMLVLSLILMMMLLFSLNPKNREGLNLLKLKKMSFLLNWFTTIKMTSFVLNNLTILKNKNNLIIILCSKMIEKLDRVHGQNPSKNNHILMLLKIKMIQILLVPKKLSILIVEISKNQMKMNPKDRNFKIVLIFNKKN